jgi:hypothetical protein
MAAWRIAHAWQAYKRSAARAAKLQAAECLQAAFRGVAARRLVQQLRLQQKLLVELQQALQQGQQGAVQQAADRARAAGVWGGVRLAMLIAAKQDCRADTVKVAAACLLPANHTRACTTPEYAQH